MLVTQSLRGDGKGESKPRNKRKYDEGSREKHRREDIGGRPGQKLPKRARGDDDDDDVDDADLDDEDDFDEDDDFDMDEDDFDIDEDDDLGSEDDWDKDDE